MSREAEDEATDLVAGGLDPRARRALQARLLADPRFAAEVAALERALGPMAARGGAVPPPPSVWAGIEAAIEAEQRIAGYATDSRIEDGPWEQPAPGVVRKRLWDDRTFLARLDPGTWYDPHEHRQAEHCLVLAGSMVVEGVRYGPGDYHAPRAGSRHGLFGTEEGLLLLVRYGD